MVDELQLVTPLLELSDVKRAIDVSCIRAVQSASCKPNFARVRAGELAATMRWAGTGATVRRKARRQTQCEHTQYRSSYERSLTDTMAPHTVVYTRCVYVNTCRWATCVCTFCGTHAAEQHTMGGITHHRERNWWAGATRNDAPSLIRKALGDGLKRSTLRDATPTQ